MTDTVTLPLCPSSNRYWRVYRGRAVKSQAARDYAAVVQVLARAAGLVKVPAPWKVRLVIWWQRRERRGDLDNRLKVVLDALQGVAFDNDNQVTELHAFLSDGYVENRLVVTVRRVVVTKAALRIQ